MYYFILLALFISTVVALIIKIKSLVLMKHIIKNTHEEYNEIIKQHNSIIEELKNKVECNNSKIIVQNFEIEELKTKNLQLEQQLYSKSMELSEIKKQEKPHVPPSMQKVKLCHNCQGKGYYLFHGGTRSAACSICHGTGLHYSSMGINKIYVNNNNLHDYPCYDENGYKLDLSYNAEPYNELSHQAGDTGGEYCEMNHSGDD